ncbi:YcaO-like family protein [Treponema putidum]|uniref:YcaO domain-containing protein n=1 Tax=Treponema putidum TaxID=221027 RepID=A0AAE9MT67_9SPIR|nr:YcaO-like family protein [Treponema putidum]UTY27677.1 hypothetical protein E4N76_00750 [Treponema putidum]UTY32593.1 hypothetical protein E4N74_00100 [Treponema putidum]
MFDYLEKSFFLHKTVFLNDPIISMAVFKVEKTKDKKAIFPYGHTSAGKNKQVVLGKLYSEYLERFKMSANSRYTQETQLISLQNLKPRQINRSMLGYDIDKAYGKKDTTGTASGLRSAFIIEKAIMELIEKNELMLMWYKKYCKKLIKTKLVKDIITQYGLQTNAVEIFYSQNISNIHTIAFFIFDSKKQIVGSGISGDKNSVNALKSAIEEAIMQHLLNKSFFIDFKTPEFKKYFLNLSMTIEKININTLKPIKKIEIQKEFNDIEIGLLNISAQQREITIKALSRRMLNCVPFLGNIKCNLDKYIVKYFEIDKEVENALQCPVI